MKERPILFSGPMVSAILAGRKTQTRRAMKPQPHQDATEVVKDGEGYFFDYQRGGGEKCLGGKWTCPYDVPRLWVKETWKYADWTEDGVPWIEYAAGGRMLREPSEEWGDRVSDIWAELSVPNCDGPACDRRWRSSLHMPRWASRLTLEVVSVRVERVQEITEADAIAEGIRECENHTFDGGGPAMGPTASHAYMRLWDTINGNGSWAANPWVWCVEFRRTA